MHHESEKVQMLREILFDRHLSISERDDAAIDLGQFDVTEALDALLTIALNPQEDELVLSSCGESIALIWLRTGKFDSHKLAQLADPAQVEARALIKSQQPTWLDEET